MTPREFIKTKIKEISDPGLKSFPDDFSFPCLSKEICLPDETLIIGNEFFGSFEVMTVNGELFCHTDTLLNAKYYAYASGKKKRIIRLPLNLKDIGQVVKNYEKYLDEILKGIEKDYSALFPDSRDIDGIINEIFTRVNLRRL